MSGNSTCPAGNATLSCCDCALSRLGRSQLLSLAELPHGHHRAGSSLGQPGKMWQSKNIFMGKIIPHGDVFLALSPCRDHVPAHRASALMGVSIPWVSASLGAVWIQLRALGLAVGLGLQGCCRSGCPCPPEWLPWARLPPSLQSPCLGVAGGFPVLLKIRSKNSIGFWHGHRTGCRGNAAVGEEGESAAFGLPGWHEHPTGREMQGTTSLCPLAHQCLPCLVWLLGGAWYPPCSSFWGCWGASSAQVPQVRPPQILHSHGWHSWSHGDVALSCGQHRVPLLGCLVGTACRSHPQVWSGTGM